MVGFLLVYVLNESTRIDIHMRAGFVALFVFAFAVAAGTFWEIFEFAVDQFFGTQMQKPMLGDSSGLTDTMWDLIVDTLGAAVISVFGWWHMKREQRSLSKSGLIDSLNAIPGFSQGSYAATTKRRTSTDTDTKARVIAFGALSGARHPLQAPVLRGGVVGASN